MAGPPAHARQDSFAARSNGGRARAVYSATTRKGERMLRKSFACLAIATLLAACTTDPYTGERRVSRTAIGAGTGALAGAGIGVLIGKHRGRNAAIGAGIGALSG